MRCTVLASGSKGNCVFIDGESGAVLIDAGLSASEALLRMTAAGLDRSRVSAILVTHEHGDHVRGLDVLARRLDVSVHATAGTLDDFLSFRKTSKKPVHSHVCRYHEHFSTAGFTIEPFATSHDAAEPCGFLIREHDLAFVYCTDTGIITPRMLSLIGEADGIMLESNHCPEMLRTGPYTEALKRRIRSKRGHLSNAAAAACLQALGRDVPRVILAHLSEINNTPDRAMASARDGLGLFFERAIVTVATQRGTCAGAPQCLTL